MFDFRKAASAIADACKSVLKSKTVKPAADAVRGGIDILEAAGLNKDHKHLPASSHRHLVPIFASAAALAVVGVAVPVLGTGLTVSLVGLGALEAAKLLVYRGLRVTMPYDPNNLVHPRGVGLKSTVHGALDFFEAVSLNKPHPWMDASRRSAAGKTFAMAAVGIGIGVALTAGTVGLPALAGVAITEAGKFAAYRGYRTLVPFKSGLEEKPSPQAC